MTQNLSPQIARVLALSKAEARRTHQDKVGAVALLLGMLNDREGAALKVIEQFGISTDQLRNTLEAQIKPSIDEGSVATEGAEVARDVDRILRLAQLEARLQRENNATDVHLFLAMLRDKTNEGCKVLASFNLNYDNAMKFIAGDGKLRAGASPLASNTPDDEEAIPAGGEPRQGGRRGADFVANNSTDKDTPILDSYGVDLTKAAADGALDPIVGRHDEIERMAQILTRRKKNNPILIGEPGVGKSALVEGLAQLIVQNKVPHLLTGKRLISLDMASIVAGTQYRGQFEDRLRKLIGELKAHREVVLFIDEIHTIIGAGSAPGSLDAANILKPALARGEVQCIGATTISEFRKSIEKDGALDHLENRTRQTKRRTHQKRRHNTRRTLLSESHSNLLTLTHQRRNDLLRGDLVVTLQHAPKRQRRNQHHQRHIQDQHTPRHLSTQRTAHSQHRAAAQIAAATTCRTISGAGGSRRRNSGRIRH
mgnify:CR=1 FL=1